MPQQSRIDAPGALHHVIIRGIERKAISKDLGALDRYLLTGHSVIMGNQPAEGQDNDRVPDVAIPLFQQNQRKGK